MARVLVVEDDFLNRELFRVLLKKKGNFEVKCSEDPVEILGMVERREVDAVVMDVALANSTYLGKPVDGIAITRMLKQNPETGWIPVLLATAHSMKGDSERFCELSNADGYVSKPIADPEGFVRRVELLIERSKTG